MNTITGYYNRFGYFLENEKGEEIYRAGNHWLESTSFSPLGAPETVPLRKIRAFCLKTARQEAMDSGANFGGIERILDDEYQAENPL